MGRLNVNLETFSYLVDFFKSATGVMYVCLFHNKYVLDNC